MIVSDEAEVVDRLYRLADVFRESYRKKDYPVAMSARHTAMITVLTLMEKDNESDKELLKVLFGEGNGPGEDCKGMFNRDEVEKAHWECIKRDINAPYVDAMGLLRVIGIIS